MSSEKHHSKEENDAACAVISLFGRASLPQNKSDTTSRGSVSKSPKSRILEAGRRLACKYNSEESTYQAQEPPTKKTRVSHARRDVSDEEETEKKRSLLDAPFFYYRDHSLDQDDDPLVPLTPPGKTPNFPAKMHAILSNPDLADIIEWLPHGRSWRIIKPREFEHRVLPRYFEHSKFSSFVRQTNGWGFRRISNGLDRNAYYNELFLRGLPHLCKKMKRHGVSEKITIDAKHEPHLEAISKLYPVPLENGQDDLVVLESVIDEGPRARMPVRYDAIAKCSAPVFGQDLSVTTSQEKLSLDTPLTVPQVQRQSAKLRKLKDLYQCEEQASISSMETEEKTRPESFKSSSSISENSREQRSSNFATSSITSSRMSDADTLSSYFSILAAKEKVRRQQELEKQNAIQAQNLISFLGAPSSQLLHIQNRSHYNLQIPNTTIPQSANHLSNMCGRASIASHLEAAASHIRSAISQSATIQTPQQHQPQHNLQALSSLGFTPTCSLDAQALANLLQYNGMK